MARSPRFTQPTEPDDFIPDSPPAATSRAAAARKKPGSGASASRRTRRKARKPPGLVLVRRRNRIYWIEGTYLGVRVRASTFETDLAWAKQVLSDKLKLVRDNRDAARASATCGTASVLTGSQTAFRLTPVPLEPLVEGSPVNRTFSEACNGYLDNRGPTRDEWRKLVEKIRDFVGPELRCRHAVTNEFITRTTNGLGKQLASEATVKRQIVTPIKAVLTWAAGEWGADQGCFAPKFRKMAGDRINNTVMEPHVAEDVIKRALERGYHCLAAVIAFTLCQGPRRSELFNFVLEDFNMVTGRLVFRKVKDRSTGNLKSKTKRNRTIPCAHRRAMEVLVDYVALTGRTEGPVFVRDSGALFPSVKAFGDEMNALLQELTESLPDHYHLHVLRHSFASYEYAVRPDPEWVRQQGDWATLSSAMRYVHLLGERTREAVLAFWRETPLPSLAHN